MAQQTLVAPDSHTKLPATTLENKENGESYKRSLEYIQAMFTELYALLTTGTAAVVSTLSGVGDAILTRDPVFYVQAAPAAKTTSTTLTAAELLGGLLTVNQGAAGASALTLPLATSLDTALAAVTSLAANDSFEFSLINISTNAAEDATMTTNTGWTLVGEMTVESNDADRARSSGLFRARKTAAGAWTLYRIA